MYEAFNDLDASIVEINPLVVTGSGDVVALDAKMNFDDNALFRHKDVAELRDEDEEDPAELEAGKHYVGTLSISKLVSESESYSNKSRKNTRYKEYIFW